jgi:hypothetical protein
MTVTAAYPQPPQLWLSASCRTKGAARTADVDRVEDRALRTQTPSATPLGPRLAGLALLCVTLFALATLVGLFANAYA